VFGRAVSFAKRWSGLVAYRVEHCFLFLWARLFAGWSSLRLIIRNAILPLPETDMLGMINYRMGGRINMRFQTLLALAASLVVCATGPASADALLFPDTTANGITYSGLSMISNVGADGTTGFEMTCIATPQVKNIPTTIGMNFIVLTEDNQTITAFGEGPFSIVYGTSSDCHQGGAPVADKRKPVKLKIEIMAPAENEPFQAVLEPAALTPEPDGKILFKPINLDGVTFSGLTVVQNRASPTLVQYVVECKATGVANETRTFAAVAFFLRGKDGVVPYAWTETWPNKPLVLKDGETKDCGVASAAYPDFGKIPSGMSIKATEILSDRKTSITMLPMGPTK
jgi:hypothetical protein